MNESLTLFQYQMLNETHGDNLTEPSNVGSVVATTVVTAASSAAISAQMTTAAAGTASTSLVRAAAAVTTETVYAGTTTEVSLPEEEGKRILVTIFLSLIVFVTIIGE